jgi:hypothetical protein
MAGTKRGFGQTGRRKNGTTGKTSGWRARYEGPDGFRHSFTITTKADAEAFLRGEGALIARGAWVPVKARMTAVSVSVGEYAVRSLAVRSLHARARSTRRVRTISGGASPAAARAERQLLVAHVDALLAARCRAEAFCAMILRAAT